MARAVGRVGLKVWLSAEEAAALELAAVGAGVARGALARECVVRYAAGLAVGVSEGRVRLRGRSASGSRLSASAARSSDDTRSASPAGRERAMEASVAPARSGLASPLGASRPAVSRRAPGDERAEHDRLVDRLRAGDGAARAELFRRATQR